MTQKTEWDQYLLRMPPGLRKRIAKKASENGRSVAAEIICAIEEHLKISPLKELHERIRRLEMLLLPLAEEVIREHDDARSLS
jgi:hypothetical protein